MNQNTSWNTKNNLKERFQNTFNINIKSKNMPAHEAGNTTGLTMYYIFYVLTQ